MVDAGAELVMNTPVSLRVPLLVAAAFCVAAVPTARGQQQATNQPGTKWTDEQLHQSVELARVGRKLTPQRWPNDARVAVCLSFDTDSEARSCATGRHRRRRCRRRTSAPRAALRGF